MTLSELIHDASSIGWTYTDPATFSGEFEGTGQPTLVVVVKQAELLIYEDSMDPDPVPLRRYTDIAFTEEDLARLIFSDWDVKTILSMWGALRKIVIEPPPDPLAELKLGTSSAPPWF